MDDVRDMWSHRVNRKEEEEEEEEEHCQSLEFVCEEIFSVLAHLESRTIICRVVELSNLFC